MHVVTDSYLLFQKSSKSVQDNWPKGRVGCVTESECNIGSLCLYATMLLQLFLNISIIIVCVANFLSWLLLILLSYDCNYRSAGEYFFSFPMLHISSLLIIVVH